MKNIRILFPEGKHKALTFSYDDGASTDREMIRILNGYGMKGTFNLNSGSFGKDYGDWKTPAGEYIQSLSRGELSALYAGHEIAVHGVSHGFWSAAPRERALYDILEDRRALEQIAGYPVRGLAYPFDAYDAGVREIVQAAGFRYARAAGRERLFQLPHDPLRFDATCWHTDPDLMERAAAFLREDFNTNALFCLAGHSFEFAMDGNWQVLDDFCKLTAGREEVWYTTCIAVFDYLDAAKALRFTADCSIVCNPTATQVFLDADGQTFSVGPGETVRI